MATFDEIPFEVFTTAILPCLTAVDVGRLSQVNQMWKDFSDNPVVWKHLYLQLTPGKILDTSLHIGPKSARTRDYNQEYKVFRTTGKVTIIYRGGYPFVPYTTNRRVWVVFTSSWCATACQRSKILNRGTGADGINPVIFTQSCQICVIRVTLYRNYVNRMGTIGVSGLSTVNSKSRPLCYRYLRYTDCKKKRSFKKATPKSLKNHPKQT